MKIRLLLVALMLCAVPAARAQFGNFGDAPIEINSSETRFENGIAIAQGDVVVHYGPTTVYADYAQYHPDTRDNPGTRDILAVGNVRIYRDGYVFVGDRALYNMETKVLRTGAFRSESTPFLFQAQAISSMEGNNLLVSRGLFTTSDSSKPDYCVKARTVRIYPDDRIVFTDATVYIGTTPVFWLPYIYQGLKRDAGLSFAPGYGNSWGAYLLTQYGVPITETLYGIFRFDLRSSRGAAVGFDLKGTYGNDNSSWIRFQNYYAYDDNPETNPTAQVRAPVSHDRYRLALQSRTYFTEDLYASTDINYLSDQYILRDFFPAEFHNDPQPDTSVTLTKWSENYTLTGIVRPSVNDFFDITERLPEAVLDMKRQPLFGSPVFYEGETGFAKLNRIEDISNDPEYVLRHSYGALRFDTFHQLVAPFQLWNTLSMVPRIGIRGTYYSRSAADVQEQMLFQNIAQTTNLQENATVLNQEDGSGGIFRPVFNMGMESSFKLSREWEEAQSRCWGLDGLRHVVQPYSDISFVRTDHDPEDILQFDRLTPSTQLPSFDFPQFTALDTISNWSVLRLGVRNRLETRRDNRTFTWLETDSFFCTYLENPNFPVPGWVDNSRFSNVFNRITWTPLPWASFGLDSQLPLLAPGFSEVNTTSTFMVNEDLRLILGHRFLNDNEFFENSSNIRFGGYYRINDNWGFSFSEQYEAEDSTLESQNYQIHRDLSSWVASLGFSLRENRNRVTHQRENNVGVVLTFTLKDVPSLRLPIALDPTGVIGSEEAGDRNK